MFTNVQQDSEAISLERALGILRRRTPLVALCIVVVAGAAFGFSKQKTKQYTAAASLAFNSNPLSRQIAGLPVSNASSALLAQEASNVELVKGGDMAAKTASLLGHGLTEEKVFGSLSVAGQGESGIVVVTATTTSPTLSAEIANTYTFQFVKEQQSANEQYYKAVLKIVHKQLARLSPRQRVGSNGVQLQARAQTLSLLSELKEGDAAVVATARAPTSPSSPKTSKNIALGIVVGLLIGVGLAFVLERFDRRIRSPEELEEIYHLPLLGAISSSAALSRPARDKRGARAVVPAAEAEAFSLIRARLRFFNIDRNLRTVVIASAEPGDGKTTIARHLAEAAARLGSRVLLLEVDLRHPTLAQQLDIRSEIGLADVLIDAVPISEATQSVDLNAAPGEGVSGRTLDVLLAGALLPPNPGELLESDATDVMLERARAAYDLVVIDTPPLTAVSDAFPLLTKVDGIVIVGRIGQSRRDAAERLHQVLASSGAPLLGVIANGSKSGDPTAYADSRDGKSSSSAARSIDRASSSEKLAPSART
jgi:capsular exopolysaccharide synthesis family protein